MSIVGNDPPVEFDREKPVVRISRVPLKGGWLEPPVIWEEGKQEHKMEDLVEPDGLGSVVLRPVDGEPPEMYEGKPFLNSQGIQIGKLRLTRVVQKSGYFNYEFEILPVDHVAKLSGGKTMKRTMTLPPQHPFLERTASIVGTVNKELIWGCAAGSLLLETADWETLADGSRQLNFYFIPTPDSVYILKDWRVIADSVETPIDPSDDLPPEPDVVVE